LIRHPQWASPSLEAAVPNVGPFRVGGFLVSASWYRKHNQKLVVGTRGVELFRRDRLDYKVENVRVALLQTSCVFGSFSTGLMHHVLSKARFLASSPTTAMTSNVLGTPNKSHIDLRISHWQHGWSLS
jgi:hypothetical protein